MRKCSGTTANVARRALFVSDPWCLPVGPPVPTVLSWAPDLPVRYAHRVVVSTPVDPLTLVELRPGGKLRTDFISPENPNNLEDLGELWFDCQQQLTTGAYGRGQTINEVDLREWTAVRRVIKLIYAGFGVLTISADLVKPFRDTFAKFTKPEIDRTCSRCGVVVGSGEGPDMAAARAAASDDNVRVCIGKQCEATIQEREQLQKDLERMARAANEARRRQLEEEARREQIAKERMTERLREHDRNTKSARDYDRWKQIERIA